MNPPDDNEDGVTDSTDANTIMSTSLRHRLPSEKFTSDIEEEFACPVCLRLVVLPTTLNCGHTSCRACLAQWYFNSNKKECPLCREEYHGHPMVNTQIKNLIETHCAEKLKERLKDDEQENNMDIVKKYDEELSNNQVSGNKSTSDVTSFCSGIIVALAVFVVAYLAWYWQSSDATLLVKKPVEAWKPNDVATWMSELGWAKDYTDFVKEQQIDGILLLSLTEDSLQSRFNMTDSAHRKALMFAVGILAEQGVKMPATLWEYKALYPGRCLFLVYSLKDFPRTALLYLYVYFHDEMFMPFLQTTVINGSPSLPVVNSSDFEFPQEPEVSLTQWVTFILCSVIIPESLVIVFAYQMFEHHAITPLFVITTATLYTLIEWLTWGMLYQESGRSFFPLVKVHMKQLLHTFMFMVLWPVVPNLMCDILFYGALYVSPVHAFVELYNKIRDMMHDVR